MANVRRLAAGSHWRFLQARIRDDGSSEIRLEIELLVIVRGAGCPC
ncbi:MAG: hypothetical protein AAGF24_01020 [Cyanobacteria bacterium P01_H01_bin.121]